MQIGCRVNRAKISRALLAKNAIGVAIQGGCGGPKKQEELAFCIVDKYEFNCLVSVGSGAHGIGAWREGRLAFVGRKCHQTIDKQLTDESPKRISPGWLNWVVSFGVL